ncbi:uncharacterized protein LOC144711883 [Wolffia australiana]
MGRVTELVVLLLLSFFFFFAAAGGGDNGGEVAALMEVKYALDPEGRVLSSWTAWGNPCGGGFLGVGCDAAGKVSNISLQGKGLSGVLSPALAELRSLSGLFLHYNSLTGDIPSEISKLSSLSDLYINVNNFSGAIPPEFGDMASLQVLQLGYNQLSGSLPNQLGAAKGLAVLAAQSNRLTGAIPASLGDLPRLSRLDLSFNQLFGSIPGKLAQVSGLSVLDVRGNALSGNVPAGLKRLGDGFQYGNNSGLCGAGFGTLQACSSSSGGALPEPSQRGIPQSANIKPRCAGESCPAPARPPAIVAIVAAVVAAAVASLAAALALAGHCRRKQNQRQKPAVAVPPRPTSPAYGGWDPLADGRSGGGFSEEVSQSLRFNLEAVESATQYFSDVNLLGKSGFAATFKGLLRDGAVVAVKRINKSSCRSDEGEFLAGLKLLSSLRHDNLVPLRGFCCSRARGECFLVYDFIPNGSLAQYLDGPTTLDWPSRVGIIKGVARGIEFLHGSKGMVHQSLSAGKVLIDEQFRPRVAGAGVQRLLADDIVFSSLKASAAMGYLAPEYTTTGRFTEKGDVYAFGVLILQVLAGRREVEQLRLGGEACGLEGLIDKRLEGNYSKHDAAKLAAMAVVCTSDDPERRPCMADVLLELGGAVAGG